MRQRRDAGQILVLHLVSGGTKLVDDAGDVDGVPDQHGIGEQAEAAGLVHHLLVVAGAEAAPVGEEQRFGEDVAELAAVELQLDGVTQRLLLDVAQNVQRLHQPPELSEGAGETVRRVGIGQALHDDMGRGQPVLQRRREAHQLIPLFHDKFDIDAAAQQRLQRTVVGIPVKAAEHLVRQILQPGHESNAKQHAKTEQVRGKAVGI